MTVVTQAPVPPATGGGELARQIVVAGQPCPDAFPGIDPHLIDEPDVVCGHELRCGRRQIRTTAAR